MKRSQNQDHYLVAPEMNLFVVADGMGGHKGGETASHLAVDTIADYFRALTAIRAGGAAMDAAEKVQHAIQAANSAIQKRGQSEPALQGMGTTTTGMFFTNDKLYIGHVGDSRGYLIHPKRIWQLTRDHSLVQEKLRAGLITRAQLKTDRMKNVITRSVGFENDVDVDLYELEPHPGDIFLLCSDGLSGMVDDVKIQQIVEVAGSIETAAKKLVDAANESGGDDNVTAVLVQVY